MKLAYLLLADAAQITADGKVSIFGGDFDTIYAATFPATHGTMALVVRIDFDRQREVGREHRIRIVLYGPPNRTIAVMDSAPLTPTVAPNHRGRWVKVISVVGLHGLTFPQEGDYRFVVSSGDTTLGESPLYLVRIPELSGGIMRS